MKISSYQQQNLNVEEKSEFILHGTSVVEDQTFENTIYIVALQVVVILLSKLNKHLLPGILDNVYLLCSRLNLIQK